MSTMTTRLPHLDCLWGRGDWVGGCDAEYTWVLTISLSTATEMLNNDYGKLCSNDVKEMSAYMWQRR